MNVKYNFFLTKWEIYIFPSIPNPFSFIQPKPVAVPPTQVLAYSSFYLKPELHNVSGNYQQGLLTLSAEVLLC